MTFESTLATLGPLVAVLAPMIGAPLGLITFYLRALRENVAQSHTALARRVDAIESTALELRRTLGEIPRDYTTKEEWLRELLHNRRVLEQVTEATIRLQSTLDALFTHSSNRTLRFNETNPEKLAANQSQGPLREHRNNPNRDHEGTARSSKSLDESNRTIQVGQLSTLPLSQTPLPEQSDNPNRDREGAALYVGSSPNRESPQGHERKGTTPCPALHTESVPFNSPGQRPGEKSST